MAVQSIYVFEAAEFAPSIVTDKPLPTASDSSDPAPVNTVSTAASQSEGTLATRVVSCKFFVKFSIKLAKLQKFSVEVCFANITLKFSKNQSTKHNFLK